MPQRLGIIGHPIGHSISPVFQQAALDAIGFDGTYQPWDVAPGDVGEFVDGLRAPGTLGINVTVPHKEAVIPSSTRSTTGPPRPVRSIPSSTATDG